MGDEVKIDRDTFNNRLSHFVSTWKGDKRQSNDALFGSVGSIVVLLGRNEESQSFQKNNAMHVGASSVYFMTPRAHSDCSSGCLDMSSPPPSWSSPWSHSTSSPHRRKVHRDQDVHSI